MQGDQRHDEPYECFLTNGRAKNGNPMEIEDAIPDHEFEKKCLEYAMAHSWGPIDVGLKKT